MYSLVFWGTEIFSIENFVKTKINGYLKVQWLVNTTDESELSRQAVTVFAWSSKSLALSWWRIMCFLLTDSGHFSSSTAFSWPNWVGINHSSFQKEFITGDSFPIPSYTQYHLGWRLSFGEAGVGLFHLHHNLTLLYSNHFLNHLSQPVF